jgi:hypothetical protein
MGKASRAKRDGITEEQAKAALQQAQEARTKAFQQELDALLKKHGKRIGAIAVPAPRQAIGPLMVGAQVIYVDAPEPQQPA